MTFVLCKSCTILCMFERLYVDPANKLPTDGGDRRRHSRPNESYFRFPTCSHQQRSSGASLAQAGHGGAFPDSTHDRTVCNILSSHVAVTNYLSTPTVGRSHVSAKSADATHVSPDNSGNKADQLITTVCQPRPSANRPRKPGSPDAYTDHIAETFRQHSNVKIPVGIRM